MRPTEHDDVGDVWRGSWSKWIFPQITMFRNSRPPTKPDVANACAFPPDIVQELPWLLKLHLKTLRVGRWVFLLGRGRCESVMFSSQLSRAQDPVQDGIPCLWFPAPKAATVILFFHANAEPWVIMLHLLGGGSHLGWVIGIEVSWTSNHRNLKCPMNQQMDPH